MRVSLQQTAGASNGIPTGVITGESSSLSLCHLPILLFQGEEILNLTGFIVTITKRISNTYKAPDFKIS